MSGQHSILAPSAANIWGPDGCPGWVAMAAAYPEREDSEAAREGTAAHELAPPVIEAALRGQPAPEPFDVASNGVAITDDMVESAELYTNDVIAVLRRTGVFRRDLTVIEELIACPDIHELCFGSPDMALYYPADHKLYVWDFKFGRVPVDVYENRQMTCYASGLMRKFGIDGLLDQSLRVEFRIVQPRAWHQDGSIRSWETTGAELRGLVNSLHNAANAALASMPTLKTGEYCRHCSALHACPAAAKAGAAMLEAAQALAVMDLDANSIGVAYALAEQARARSDAIFTVLDEQVKHMIRRGQNVAGYRMDTKKGREMWAHPDDVIYQVGDLLGIELRKTKPLTPKQARAAGADPDLITTYSQQNPGAAVVVRDTTEKAQRIFKS